MTISNKKIVFILPLLIGIFSSFSLPPYNYYLINFISFPLLLIHLIQNHKYGKFRLFCIGWIFGFGYFISNIYWLTNSLTFDKSFIIFIPFALFLVPLFLGLFYGLASLCCGFFNFGKKFSSLLIFCIFFSITEYLRGLFFGGFPWNLISYSLSEILELIQILAFVGTYTFNLLIITFFSLPALLFFNHRRNIKLFISVFSILIILSNFALGRFTIENFNNFENKKLNFTIKLVSPEIEISRFLDFTDPIDTIINLIDISEPNPIEKTLFIFPEGIIPNIEFHDLKNYKDIFSQKYSKNHKIILGMTSIEKNQIFNSLVLIDNNTNLLYKYKKNKLVPFGEFLPFENFLGKLGLKKITSGYQSFSAANTRNIMTINGLNFLPLICYEIIYSGRIGNKQEYDFILNISEDGWFGKTVGPHQHFAHSIFRSIEEGKNLIRSTNNGISAVIDPKGQVIDYIMSQGVIEVKTFKTVENTLFQNHGNTIFFYFLFIYITLTAFLKLRENK